MSKKGVMSLHSSFMCAVHAQFQAVLNPREIFFRRSQAIILWVCIVDTFDIGELFLPPSFFMLVWRSWEMRGRSFRFLSLSINTRQDQFSWEKSNNQKDNKFSLRKRNKQRKIKSIPSFSQEKKVTNDHHFDSKQKNEVSVVICGQLGISPFSKKEIDEKREVGNPLECDN